MNLNRIVMMVMNIVIRRLVNLAINFGLRAASGYGSPASEPDRQDRAATPPGAEARALQVDAARRARIAARTLRRLGR